MEGNKNFARKYDLSLGPILCGQTHFARVQMAMSTNGSRLLQFAADEIESDEFVEDLRRYLALPRMVPEIRLPKDVLKRQHFLQWHPRVFQRGNVWNTVSFLLDGNITANEIYLFVAVLFSVDNKMRDGEPRVWRELIAAWDATFGLAAGELRPNVNERRYGSLTDPAIGRPGNALDYALSGESCNFTSAEHHWLKDCQNYYQDVKEIDSLEKLHDVRECMVTEGPRWWKDDRGELHWMPRRFWGANGANGR